jgi:hypothetical protein
MRLIRQTAPADWDGVIAETARSLKALVAAQ